MDCNFAEFQKCLLVSDYELFSGLTEFCETTHTKSDF